MDIQTNKADKGLVKIWSDLIDDLGDKLRANGKRHDQKDTFVEDNYNLLKKEGILTAIIPESLGGGGVSHKAMCRILIKIAHYCPSTALALSMHQHLLATTIWKYLHEGTGEELLKEVVEKNQILVSTGARDWLYSNGTMEKTDGGYLVSADKHFASQSAVGDVLVTSAPFNDPEKGLQVLHFRVPMNSNGVQVLDDWCTLGMRGTGSQTVKLEKVFVPDAAIVMQRSQGEYPVFWNVILTVALPLIMAPYVGIAQRAMEIALENAQKKENRPPNTPFLLGEMYNNLTTAEVMLKDMIEIANNLDFKEQDSIGAEILARKTLVANSCKETLNKAMESVGGKSFYRSFEMERLFRDVQAASFHTLPEKQQQHFTGVFLLKQK